MKTLHLFIIVILLVSVFFSSSLVFAQHIPFTLTQSPLKQFKGGTIAHDVHCNSGLQLVLKAEYYTPACVKPETASKLVQRGWALDTTLPEPFIKKIAITGLQQNYTIGQPINATVTYVGYYWYAEPDVKILDANGTQIWFNCAYCYARTEPVPSPALDTFTYIVRDYSSNKLPMINKTGTYTMITSLENKTASAEFTVVKPLMPNRIIGLENDTGIATLGNQIYYFETPNYTDTAFSNPVQISFHDVVFTLFPPGFRGGLPTGTGCEGTTTGIISGSGSYYWTDAKFPDGTHELLNIFAYSKLSCPVHSIPTDFSTHANPQAGLTFHNGKMKLLVSVDKVSQKEDTIPTSFEPCDTPYPQSNTGIAVLYMPANSTGKLCVDYSNPNPSRSADVTIFEARHMLEDTKDIQVLPSQDNIPQGSSTMVYTLKTSKVGFYGLTLFCYGTPLAVGYDNQSRIVANDFPWLGGTYYCPMQSYTFHISGLSGMGVKYIPYP
jgi:hypothetical protein